MCDSPVQIKNPNFAPRFDKLYKYGVNPKYNISRYSAIKYPLDSYIYVPCGHCQSCLRMAQQYMIQRFEQHARGKYVLFCTATYQNSALPRLEGVLKDGNPYSIPYADTRDFRLMVKRIRKNHLFSRDFTYWCTTEYGNDSKHGSTYKSNHRPHFHYFIFIEKQQNDNDDITPKELSEEWEQVFIKEWRRNLGSTRNPNWLPLSKFIKMSDGTGTYDVHALVSLDGHDDLDAIYYASSYCYSYDEYVKKTMQFMYCNLDYADYVEFRKQFRPRRLMSLKFGISSDTDQYILDCINFSLKSNLNFPCYFNHKGESSPLSRYYKDKYLTIKQYLQFCVRNPEGVIKDPDTGEIICNTRFSPVFDSKKLEEIRRSSIAFQRICLNLRKQRLTFEFDDD